MDDFDGVDNLVVLVALWSGNCRCQTRERTYQLVVVEVKEERLSVDAFA